MSSVAERSLSSMVFLQEWAEKAILAPDSCTAEIARAPHTSVQQQVGVPGTGYK